MNRALKNDLRQMYAALPEPDPYKKAFLMDLAVSHRPILPRKTSLVWFIRSQLAFISKPILLLQLLLLCLYGLITGVVLKDSHMNLLLVPLAPLVVLLGTYELSGSYRWGMAELEMPARFSLVQILLARFVIAAVTDVLVLTVMLITTAMKTGCSFGALIVYGLVPSFMAAAGSLFLLNQSPPHNSGYHVAAYCISLSALGTISIERWPGWYNGAAITVWLLILAASAGVLVVELHRLMKGAASPERVYLR